MTSAPATAPTVFAPLTIEVSQGRATEQAPANTGADDVTRIECGICVSPVNEIGDGDHDRYDKPYSLMPGGRTLEVHGLCGWTWFDTKSSMRRLQRCKSPTCDEIAPVDAAKLAEPQLHKSVRWLNYARNAEGARVYGTNAGVSPNVFHEFAARIKN